MMLLSGTRVPVSDGDSSGDEPRLLSNSDPFRLLVEGANSETISVAWYFLARGIPHHDKVERLVVDAVRRGEMVDV